MSPTGWGVLVVAGIVLGSGVVMLVVGAAARRAQRPIEGSVRATAEVVAFDEEVAVIDGRDHPVRVPVYEFRDAEGTQHRHRDQLAAGRFDVTIGDRIEVSYLPADPSTVRRDVGEESWPAIVVGTGVVTILLAGALIGWAFTL